jgi:hypothetical protein
VGAKKNDCAATRDRILIMTITGVKVGDYVIPMDAVETSLPGSSVLETSDSIKAQTLDHVVKHLQNVILTETRERERKRASIALKHITKWAKYYYDRTRT